jgi:mannose-6-phosphate isomerase-like protein (cupin superfamily)
MGGMFETKVLPARRDVVAPDGSDVRTLLGLAGGALAHFELAPGAVSIAVRHRTVEEIWYVVSGWGSMWRRLGDDELIVELDAGVCLTIPVETEFQFRCDSDSPLRIVAATMPPWPGEDEATRVPGPWLPTV